MRIRHRLILAWVAALFLLLPGGARAQDTGSQASSASSRTVQLLPEGLLYPSYLAGEKEPRLGGAFVLDADGRLRFDASLGGRLGVLRFGGTGSDGSEGWQLDVEAAAFPRLNLDEISSSFESADFRFGFPITYRRGALAVKSGYYHLSSHVGDEFLERHPGFVRANYVRDAWVSGVSYLVRPNLVAYGEAAYAFYVSGGAEPWELQLGTEFRPRLDGCGSCGPVLAMNAHLREEFDLGGTVTVLAGWEWRSRGSDRLLRLGVEYRNGKSTQYAFFDEDEEIVGLMIHFDY